MCGKYQRRFEADTHHCYRRNHVSLGGVRVGEKRFIMLKKKKTRLGLGPPVYVALYEGCRLFLFSLRWAVRRQGGGARPAVTWAGSFLLTNRRREGVVTEAGQDGSDARVGGASLLFTYRSRWPLFTSHRDGACWDPAYFWLCTHSPLLMGQIRR